MNLTDRVSALFKRTKKMPELSSSVVHHDRLDDGVYDDMIERAEHFRTAVFDTPEIDFDGMTDDEGQPIELDDETRERAENYVAWEDLMGDTFKALHTHDHPELKSPDEIRPSRELNRRILSQIVAAESFASTRPHTRHDDLASAFSTMSMADGLRESLQSELREFVLRAAQMEQLEDQLDELPPPPDEQGDGAGDQPGPGENGDQPNGDGGQPQPGPGQPDPHAEQRESLGQQIAELADKQQQQGMGSAVTEAVHKAVEKAEENANAISSLPGDEWGKGENLTPDQMIELAEKWRDNHELAQIAEMIGRMQRDLRFKRANRVVGGNEEIVDVKLGDDLPLALPHEKVKLKHPLLRRDFMRRYYEKDVLQYETVGYAEAGKGPIICCIDGSSSMKGMENVWARSVALSLISVARRERRDAAAVEFSTTGQVERWDFMAKQPMDPEQVLDFASHFFAGGTDITQGVQSSKELIDSVAEFKTADIVILTDGEDKYADDDEALRNELNAQGVRLHGVAVGDESNTYLEKMCETVVSAWDLAGTNSATDHLAEVIS